MIEVWKSNHQLKREIIDQKLIEKGKMKGKVKGKIISIVIHNDNDNYKGRKGK